LLDGQEEREGGIRLVAVVGRVGYLPGRYQQSRTQDGRLATPERAEVAAFAAGCSVRFSRCGYSHTSKIQLSPFNIISPPPPRAQG